MADYRENPYRKDFPLLLEEKAAYLDNAATAQRPVCVMEAEKQFYEHSNANPLRGLYELSMPERLCGNSCMPLPSVKLFLQEIRQKA